MSSWTICGLCVLFLIGLGVASDVPFVFSGSSSSVAGYTSIQIEHASTSSSDLIGVPAITQAPDNEILNFPVVGGGNGPGGETEAEKVSNFKKLFNALVQPNNTKVHEEALSIGSIHPGYCTIEQVSDIFSYMLTGDKNKKGWRYVADPRGVNNFFYANQTLMEGEAADPEYVGAGGCADFAILMSALVESIGGTTRIILASNNTTGGHAFTEIYLGQDNVQNSQTEEIISWLKQEFDTDKIFTNIDTDTKEVWLNLDWWPDQAGNPHPGGPFFTGDKNIVLYIRENYQKVPLNLPEKANKPPKLISLTSDKPSPQDTGTVVTWTAEAKDPENDQIFYKFFLNDNPITKWITDNKWVWTITDNDTGENQIEVHIRDGKYGHALQNGFDDRKSSSFNSNYSDTAWNNKGVAFYSQGKYNESIEAFDEAILLAPNDNGAWTSKGNVLAVQGKYDEAIKCYDEAIRLFPNNTDPWNSKVVALKALGKTAEENAAFAKAKEPENCIRPWLQLQLEGAIVELNVDSSKILEHQFTTGSVQKLRDGYVVTVNGAVSPDLINKLGYSGSKVTGRNNTTKITISSSPESVVANYLKNALDADVKVVGVEPVQYEIRTNVNRESLNAILAPVGGSVDTSPQAFMDGLTPQTVDDTKILLDQKLNRFGLKDINVTMVGSQYIFLDMSGGDVATAQVQDLVVKPGKFEIRIQTDDNETGHVLYGDAVESADIPSNNQGMWGVPFTLSNDGAKILQKAAIDSGATKNPQAHELSMYLDKDQIFSAPLAPELAASLQKTPSRSMVAEVGTGDAGSQKAKVLYIDLKVGALPVNVRVIGHGCSK